MRPTWQCWQFLQLSALEFPEYRKINIPRSIKKINQWTSCNMLTSWNMSRQESFVLNINFTMSAYDDEQNYDWQETWNKFPFSSEMLNIEQSIDCTSFFVWAVEGWNTLKLLSPVPLKTLKVHWFWLLYVD